MNALNVAKSQMVTLSPSEMSQISGGVIEKQGLYPRKFGDVDYLVYVDGVLIGTTYGPASTHSPDVGSGRPIDPINNGGV